MARVCIVGKEEVKKGKYFLVKDDFIISAIRKIKEFLRIPAGNQLVVCETHLVEAYKKRKKFESSTIKIVAIISLLAIIAIILGILKGNLNSLLTMLLLLVLFFLLLVFISLFNYYPSIKLSEKDKAMLDKKIAEKKAT